MPIVVDEVVITVDVRNEGAGGGGGGGGENAGGGGGAGDRQQLVEECVERVLAILADREER